MVPTVPVPWFVLFLLFHGSYRSYCSMHGSYCSYCSKVPTVPTVPTVPWFLLFLLFHGSYPCYCSYYSMVPTVPTVPWFLLFRPFHVSICSTVLWFLYRSMVPMVLPWFLLFLYTVPWFHGSYCSMVPTVPWFLLFHGSYCSRSGFVQQLMYFDFITRNTPENTCITSYLILSRSVLHGFPNSCSKKKVTIACIHLPAFTQAVNMHGLVACYRSEQLSLWIQTPYKLDSLLYLGRLVWLHWQCVL